jgi:seryl-tRNA synthetase
MSEVIAIRVPKELKKEYIELNPDYAEDLRAYIEKEVKRKKLQKTLEKVDKFRNELGKKTGITASSAELIREDREHVH